MSEGAMYPADNPIIITVSMNTAIHIQHRSLMYDEAV